MTFSLPRKPYLFAARSLDHSNLLGLDGDLRELLISYTCRIPIEEGDEFFRVPAEVIVTVLAALGHVFDPDHFSLFGSEHVKGFLRVFTVYGRPQS